MIDQATFRITSNWLNVEVRLALRWPMFNAEGESLATASMSGQTLPWRRDDMREDETEKEGLAESKLSHSHPTQHANETPTSALRVLTDSCQMVRYVHCRLAGESFPFFRRKRRIPLTSSQHGNIILNMAAYAFRFSLPAISCSN